MAKAATNICIVLVALVVLVPNGIPALGRVQAATTDAATLFVNPLLGEVGTVVSVSGTHYQGTACTVTAEPAGLFASQSCSILAGTLEGSFTVASTAAARTMYTVRSETDAGPGDSASATFLVVVGPINSLAISPASGPVGTVVTGSASGFPSDTSCTLLSLPSGVLSSQSCVVSGMNVTIGFTVSSGAVAGGYGIVALGNTGRSATGLFTVTAIFSISTDPGSLVLSPGEMGTVTVIVLSVEGFNSPVTLAAQFPSAVSGGFSDNPVTPPPGGIVTSILSIDVSATAPSTTTAILVSGRGGGLNATASISLVIQSIVTTTSVSTSTTSSAISTTTSSATTSLYPKCIIATAAFGSEVSPTVQFLRDFRDHLVLRTKAGSAFMDVFNAWYYSFSPSVAGFIQGNDLLRAPVRVMLYPLLGILGISTLAYSMFSWAPELGVIMAGLVASSLIGLVYLTPFTFVGMRVLMKRRTMRITDLAKVSLIMLVAALTLLLAGEVAGSFLMLMIGSSAIVLICLIATSAIAALWMLPAKHE